MVCFSPFLPVPKAARENNGRRGRGEEVSLARAWRPPTCLVSFRRYLCGISHPTSPPFPGLSLVRLRKSRQGAALLSRLGSMLPPKRFCGSTSSAVVERRREALQKYLATLLAAPGVLEISAVVSFIGLDVYGRRQVRDSARRRRMRDRRANAAAAAAAASTGSSSRRGGGTGRSDGSGGSAGSSPARRPRRSHSDDFGVVQSRESSAEFSGAGSGSVYSGGSGVGSGRGAGERNGSTAGGGMGRAGAGGQGHGYGRESRDTSITTTGGFVPTSSYRTGSREMSGGLHDTSYR